MKKIVVALLAIVSLTFAAAGDLFISEYIEGSGNNKALEIFNASGATVSLDNYRIAQANNGGGWEKYHTFPAGAEIAAGDVWVMVTDAIDTGVTGFDPANADEVLSYNPDDVVVFFNGNDARGLEYTSDAGTSWELVDVFGVPTDATNFTIAGVADATKEHTVVRKSTVTAGNTDWAVSAGTTTEDSEWIVTEQNDFSNLGSHTMGGSSIENNSVASHILLSNYPNPFNPSTTINYSLENAANVTVAVYNTAGEVVANLVSGNVAAGNHSLSWNAGNLNSGVYFCQLTAGVNVVTQKMVLAK